MSQSSQHNPNFLYRSDIDGLRAVAILLVIIFHAFPKFLRGGFIGVDIFFVISGYLITSIILKNQSQNNFSLLDFYSRRIKRIFPALIVVLTFCLVAGWYVLLGNEYELLGKHIAAGSIYISNFVLQSEAGYFDTDSELKLLLHLWSLAIEEQFYLVFPLLLIIGKRFRVNSLLIISACLSVSFLANVIQISDNPSEVFFFPTSRAWELLIGSLIAYLSIYSIAKNYAEKYANPLSWIGVVLILSAWILLNSKKILFPSWWALLPTLGAACLIFAGETAWFNRKILASKIAVFIGLISYPLYLWHWVLLSFVQITELDKPKPFLKILVLCLAAFLAWLTYYFIEKNLRFQKSKFVSLGLLGILFSIGFLGYEIKTHQGYSERDTLSGIHQNIDVAQKYYTSNSLTTESCLVRYSAEFQLDLKNGFCLQQNEQQSPTSLLMGDSHANHLYSGLIRDANLTGGNLLNVGIGGCGQVERDMPTTWEKCKEVYAQVLNLALETPSIKTVFISRKAITENGKTKTLFHSSDVVEPVAPKIYIDFQNELREILKRLVDAKKKVVFVLDTPDLEFRPIACVNRPWRLEDKPAKNPCGISRATVDIRNQIYLKTVQDVLKEFPMVKVWDTIPAFCDAEYCSATNGKTLLYRDRDHLNEEGSLYLGKYFSEHYKETMLNEN